MGLSVGGGLLAPGPTVPRLPGRRCGVPVARARMRCGRRPRSQWRVRAGFAPASLTTDPERGAVYIFGAAMTVNLTRIYTKLGDGGETHLGDMSRVPKTHPRIEAYGDVDELNSQIGVTLTLPDVSARDAQWLRRIQNDLFDLGADLSVPEGGERERLRVVAEQVTWLEE